MKVLYLCVLLFLSINVDGRLLNQQLSTTIENAHEAPIVEIHPHEQQIVRIGESALLICRAIAGIPAPTLVWYRRDVKPLSQRVKEINAGTILISNITLDEAGQYECRGSNEVGSATQTSIIKVQQAPRISTIPATQELTITKGDELKLECFAEGTPRPIVQWIQQTSNEAISVINDHSSIHKYNANHSDSGRYICFAVNEAGVDEKYINVIVREKLDDPSRGPTATPNQTPNIFGRPHLRKPPKRYDLAVGEGQTITCTDSLNRPTSWQPLNRDQKHVYSANGRELIFEFAQMESAGIYQCVIGGEPVLEVELVIYEKPPAPHNVPAGTTYSIIIKSNHLNNQRVSLWRRRDGFPLPRNAHYSGGYLTFDNIQPEAEGIYEFIVHENNIDYLVAAAEIFVGANKKTVEVLP